MKNLFLAGAMLVAFNLNTMAQKTEPTFGVKAGVNLMMGGKFNIGIKDVDSKSVPGFQVGVFSNIPITEKLSFSPEVMYARKAATFEDEIANVKGQIKTKLGYIDVPMLLTINATPKFNVVVGPQASFLVDHDTRTYVNGTETASNTKKDDLKKSIFGGVVGVGYKIIPKLNINARYMYDFQTVAKENINQDKARLSGFALSLGYSF